MCAACRLCVGRGYAVTDRLCVPRSGTSCRKAERATAPTAIGKVKSDERGYPESILIVAERRNLTPPILYVPLDETEQLAQFYDYETLPATYLIDRQGVIRQEHQGAWSEQRLRAAIELELELEL